MNHSLVDINQYQTKRLSNFCDEYNLSMSSLTIFPIYYDCFIQISPNNIYIAFVKNNNILEIYVKENKKWEEKSHTKLSFDKQKIKGINWSPDSNLILVYGSEINGNNSLIIAKNLNDPNYICEIKIIGNINHASFYPDSVNIVYIKSLINILNIFSMSENNNIDSKSHKGSKKKIKNQYLYLKFDDEKSINYIITNNYTYMILPCYGRKESDRDYPLSNIEPSDYIIILADKKVIRCFIPKTNNLDRIIPLRNKYSFFIVVEKEFYKLPFYIYNLNGDVMFESEFPKTFPKIITNPCFLNNKDHETHFIVVQEPEGKLEILGCDININLSGIHFYYDYNKLYEIIEKNKTCTGDNKNLNIYGDKNKKNNNYNILSKGFFSSNDDSYTYKTDILFLEEKNTNYNKNSENSQNNRNNIIEQNNFIRKNKRNVKLVKVEPFEVDTCYNESDYLLHVEVSPINNYICFLNKKYPKFLFFGYYFQNGVFKIIKFMNNILSFKWSTQQDILLVTLDSPIFYLITKDYYFSYNLENKYNFNNITWAPQGKQVILSNEEENIRLLVILY